MEIKTLYKYTRQDNGVTISPIMPEGDYTTIYRLIASEAHAVTQNGVDVYPCLDVDNVTGWYEVEYVEPNSTTPGEEPIRYAVETLNNLVDELEEIL